MTSGARLRLEFLKHVANGKPMMCVHCGESKVWRLTGGHIEDVPGYSECEIEFTKIKAGFQQHVNRMGPPAAVKPHRWGAVAQFLKYLKEKRFPREHMDRLQLECYSCNCGDRRSMLRYYTEEELKRELDSL